MHSAQRTRRSVINVEFANKQHVSSNNLIIMSSIIFVVCHNEVVLKEERTLVGIPQVRIEDELCQ